MSPEVIARKLSKITQYLQDLEPYRNVMRGAAPPGSYRAAFLRAGEIGILSGPLSRNLSLGAGLRNILVHEHEDIDYPLLHRSLPQVIDDLTGFVEEVTSLL